VIARRRTKKRGAVITAPQTLGEKPEANVMDVGQIVAVAFRLQYTS